MCIRDRLDIHFFWFKVQFLSITSSRIALHAQLFDTVNVNNTLTLEGNFRFVLDKSDLKSASDKKFVRKATVALKNKICEQKTTPCCDRLLISAHS